MNHSNIITGIIVTLGLLGFVAVLVLLSNLEARSHARTDAVMGRVIELNGKRYTTTGFATWGGIRAIDSDGHEIALSVAAIENLMGKVERP